MTFGALCGLPFYHPNSAHTSPSPLTWGSLRLLDFLGHAGFLRLPCSDAASRPSLWLILLGIFFTQIPAELALYDIPVSAPISPPQGDLPWPPSLEGITTNHLSPLTQPYFAL